MKLIQYILIVMLLFVGSITTQAYEGVLATPEQLQMLKDDLLAGNLRPGVTRLMDVRKIYGEPQSINNTENKVTYDYGVAKLIFNKRKMWKEWGYDGFKDPVYSEAVESLRFDLESQELIGKNITYRKITRTYDLPTESMETTDDGGMSIFYYGNIKLTFENQIVLQSWKGNNLGNFLEAQDN